MTEKLEMQVKEISRGQQVELLLEGKHVSGLIINDLQMRIGRAVVHMGGIGGVHTEREHRMKGYARRVLEYSNRYMLERGYDVSLLFGIPNFYQKFGFACCLPVYRLTLTTRRAEEARASVPGDLKVRRARKGDFGRIRTIYNRHFARRTGTVVRPASWSGFRMGSAWGTKTITLVAADAQGRILSYAGFDDREDALTVFEVAGEARTYPALLSALAREAVRRRVENLTFLLPPDDPFSIYSRRFGGSMQINRPYGGGGMLRVINLPTLMEKLTPELTARLRDSGRSAERTSFVLRTDIGAVTVTVEEGEVRTSPADSAGRRPTAHIPQHRLSQLLFGFRTVADVAQEPEVRIPAAVVDLLEVLFPLHWAHVSRPDYF